MQSICFIFGLLFGILIMKIISDRERIHGIIDVDHNTEQCIFRITSEEVSNPKKKIVVFYINHNAKIDVNNSQK